jgi:hypothetical protein
VPELRTLKLLQKPHIIFGEQADVVDGPHHHGDAFDAEAIARAV